MSDSGPSVAGLIQGINVCQVKIGRSPSYQHDGLTEHFPNALFIVVYLDDYHRLPKLLTTLFIHSFIQFIHLFSNPFMPVQGHGWLEPLLEAQGTR